jgi:hypothetical protein
MLVRPAAQRLQAVRQRRARRAHVDQLEVVHVDRLARLLEVDVELELAGPAVQLVRQRPVRVVEALDRRPRRHVVAVVRAHRLDVVDPQAVHRRLGRALVRRARARRTGARQARVARRRRARARAGRGPAAAAPRRVVGHHGRRAGEDQRERGGSHPAMIGRRARRTQKNRGRQRRTPSAAARASTASLHSLSDRPVTRRWCLIALIISRASIRRSSSGCSPLSSTAPARPSRA